MTNTSSNPIPIPDTARGIAFTVLEEHRRTGNFAAPLLDALFDAKDTPNVERRFATELVHGVIRRRLTLETVIQSHVSRPRQRIEDPLWTLLQLGAYQLLLLHNVPVHAAVNETVALAKQIGRPRWGGFLNGVLRSMAKVVTDDTTDQPAADAVPIALHSESGGAYRRLKEPVFPNPDDDLAGYLSTAFSFPRWLVDRWLPRFGVHDSLQMAFWFNEPHGVTLRVNTLRTDRETLMNELTRAGISAAQGEHPHAIHLAKPTGRTPNPKPTGRTPWDPITGLPGFTKGLFTVQDESAMTAAELLAPRPGETILDLCAAPGTKTTHLAELMHNRGRIIATDVNADRLRKVNENADRLGIEIIETQPVQRDLQDVPAGPFDGILVDAPCSNTGVLGKRPEARWRIRPRDIDELAALQKRLLQTAADRLKPDGRLVYSTCSIEPEENEGVVAAFLAARFDVQLERQTTQLPGQPADGGFCAEFQRTRNPREIP